MALPVLDKETLKKPLCYNPEKKKFLYYSDLVSGKKKIVYPDALSQEDLNLLVIERLRKGPDFTMQSISGGAFTRDDTIDAIRNNEETGLMTVEAEASMLTDLLQLIEENL